MAVEAGSMEEVAGLAVGKRTTMNPLDLQIASGAVGEIHTNSFWSIVWADDKIE